VPLLLHCQASSALRTKAATLDQQVVKLAALSGNMEGHSNGVAANRSSEGLNQAQLAELLMLRNEIGRLQRATNEEAQLKAEIRRIGSALDQLANSSRAQTPPPLALYADELPAREARVAELRQWLQSRPEEVIPELGLLSETDWLRSAGGQQVTDEEFHLWISNLRMSAQTKFAVVAMEALKRFATNHSGSFPATLNQLSGSFNPPVDDATLERWEILPANSFKFLGTNWRGGDWVITQKSPVNREQDLRIVVGLTGRSASMEAGRWDPPK
jgi:hypothetical protein